MLQLHQNMSFNVGDESSSSSSLPSSSSILSNQLQSILSNMKEESLKKLENELIKHLDANEFKWKLIEKILPDLRCIINMEIIIKPSCIKGEHKIYSEDGIKQIFKNTIALNPNTREVITSDDIRPARLFMDVIFLILHSEEFNNFDENYVTDIDDLNDIKTIKNQIKELLDSKDRFNLAEEVLLDIKNFKQTENISEQQIKYLHNLIADLKDLKMQCILDKFYANLEKSNNYIDGLYKEILESGIRLLNQQDDLTAREKLEKLYSIGILYINLECFAKNVKDILESLSKIENLNDTIGLLIIKRYVYLKRKVNAKILNIKCLIDNIFNQVNFNGSNDDWLTLRDRFKYCLKSIIDKWDQLDQLILSEEPNKTDQQQCYALKKPTSLVMFSSSTTKKVDDNVILPEFLQGKFTFISMPPDGHCCYKAVVIHIQNENVSSLRKKVAERLDKDKSFYQPFVQLPYGKTIEDYIKDIRDTNAWAGDIEIEILSKELDRSIIVLDPNGQIINGSQVDQLKNGEPIFIYYNKINHYSGLILEKGHDAREILNFLIEKENQDKSISTRVKGIYSVVSSCLIKENQDKSISTRVKEIYSLVSSCLIDDFSRKIIKDPIYLLKEYETIKLYDYDFFKNKFQFVEYNAQIQYDLDKLGYLPDNVSDPNEISEFYEKIVHFFMEHEYLLDFLQQNTAHCLQEVTIKDILFDDCSRDKLCRILNRLLSRLHSEPLSAEQINAMSNNKLIIITLQYIYDEACKTAALAIDIVDKKNIVSARLFIDIILLMMNNYMQNNATFKELLTQINNSLPQQLNEEYNSLSIQEVNVNRLQLAESVLSDIIFSNNANNSNIPYGITEAQFKLICKLHSILQYKFTDPDHEYNNKLAMFTKISTN